jgi:hypothetical protein
MIIEIELAAVLLLQVACLYRVNRHARARLTAEAEAQSAHGTVRILKREGAGWVHVGHRHDEHPDIAEALRTPGLAVMRGGIIDEGVQK